MEKAFIDFYPEQENKKQVVKILEPIHKTKLFNEEIFLTEKTQDLLRNLIGAILMLMFAIIPSFIKFDDPNIFDRAFFYFIRFLYR